MAGRTASHASRLVSAAAKGSFASQTSCFSAEAARAGGAAPPKMPPFDYTPMPYDGPSKEEVMQLRSTYLNPGKFLHFKKPVMIVEGKMQYLYDETGRRYLD
eukprot:scaffold143284_cov42-Prasinocladus_malaysianus.AAC.1